MMTTLRNVPVYWEALRKLYGQGHCNVAFPKDAPIPLPKEQLLPEALSRATMIYTANKGFAWNCQVRPDADNCFHWKALNPALP